MSILVKAIKTEYSGWDIIGSSTGTYYGQLLNQELVNRVTTPALKQVTATDLDVTDLAASFREKCRLGIVKCASHVYTHWKSKKSTDPEVLKQEVYKVINLMIPKPIINTFVDLGTPTFLSIRVLEEINSLGLDPDNPVAPKTREEAVAEHVPPDEIDQAAVSLLEALQEDCEYPFGVDILKRAVKYMNNIDEILDICRLEKPGESTQYDSYIEEQLNQFEDKAKAVSSKQEDIDF